MPIFKRHMVLKLVRNTKAFLNFEVGVTRGAVLGLDSWSPSNIIPENLVWVFGTGRTGSSWFAAMVEELEEQTVWFEPRVGDVFDSQRFERHKESIHFILGDRYKQTWLRSVRTFVLDGAAARFPQLAEGGYLVIKEPGGSLGAPLLMKALPESRMILLIRDPRDVAASWLDAFRKGGWQDERKKGRGRDVGSLVDEDPNTFVRDFAKEYLRDVGNAREAYEAHEGYKAVVKYEDLLADTLGTMRRMYAELGMEVDGEQLTRAVEKHAWENIPEEMKGAGKFYRKAAPGAWREDLTPRQARIVERITAPLLREFYPA